MTIEIKELIIKATVSSEVDREKQPGKDSVDKDKIVRSCVEQVLAILKRERER